VPKEKSLRVERPTTLLNFLLAPPAAYSRKDAKNLLRFKAIAIAGAPAPRHDTPLAAGAIVRISLGKHSPAGTVLPSGMEIVHEDESILVVNKPAGLLTIATDAEKTRTAYAQLNAYVRERSPRRDGRIFIVHRLDRDTSGLLIFARTEAAKNSLQRHWKAVTKKYNAVVEGIPEDPHGTLRSALVENDTSLRVHSTDEPHDDAKFAVTHYRVLRKGAETALLELTLDTGRKNQIRVQLAEAGHPIVGDEKYGAETDPARRLALHATELNFRHPESGESLSFRSPLPDKLRSLLRSKPTALARAHPASEHPHPAPERSRPPQERSRPSQERSRPAQERSRPTQERYRPSPERSRPGQERSRPAQERSRPAQERSRPTQERYRPSPERSRPGQGRAPSAPERSRRPQERPRAAAERKLDAPREKFSPPIAKARYPRSRPPKSNR
jgi:23S rRNA pseudouridine1911/1915/1917 synthase